MADFTALKTAIQTYIKQNGNEEITGDILQEVLLSVVTTLGDSAINDLVTAVANEVLARQNADETLQQNITNEATARGNADTVLSNRLGSTITAENTAAEQIGAEAEAREAADTALQGLIDGITDNIENGYVYAGIATPSSTPATGKVFYLALTAGTYTNYGNTVVSQGINILKYNGSAWSLDVFIGIDDEPIEDSKNLIESGAVYSLKKKIISIEDSQILSFALVDNNGFVNEYIDLIGLLYDKNYNPLQIEVNDIKDILANINANINEIEYNDFVSFAVIDNNGFINEYIGRDGQKYNETISKIKNERNKTANFVVLRSSVESNLNKIHAFSVYGCFDDKGNMYALYNSSVEHLYEYLEPDSDFALEISKYNICTPYDKEFKRVFGNNDVIDGATYKTPYNSWIIRHNNVNHVNVGSMKDNIGVAFYDIIVSDNLIVGVPTPCTLTYNSTTVDFTITNYLHALYVLGIIGTDSEFEGEAIDNIKPYYYNGKYYKVMYSSLTGSGKIVILTSTDLINWTIEGTVGSESYSCTEMSLVVDSDIIYIAYRENEATGYKTGYIIYNLSSSSLINSGWFNYSIAEKPCVFKYNGSIYMLIGVETEIYNNDNERREAIEIYRISNNVPTSYLHTESPYGINYADIVIHTSEQVGNYDTLYMLYSEDKRKLAPYASYSDVAMCELTDLFINN